jgi:Domain of unknown function (DUF4234)
MIGVAAHADIRIGSEPLAKKEDPMAEQVRIDDTTGPLKTAKIRHPVAVPVFALITLGIYGVYWWYQVNREMRDLGRARNTVGLGDNPLMSLLAVFPGALILVPPNRVAL